MSERGGSDIERLWNWISSSGQKRLKMASFKFRVVVGRIRLFPTLISKIKWLGSGLPLIKFWKKLSIFPKIVKPGLESLCELFLVAWFDFSRSSEFELGKLDRPARRLLSSSLKFSTGFNLSDLSFWICCDKDTALFSLLIMVFRIFSKIVRY